MRWKFIRSGGGNIELGGEVGKDFPGMVYYAFGVV